MIIVVVVAEVLVIVRYVISGSCDTRTISVVQFIRVVVVKVFILLRVITVVVVAVLVVVE